MSIKSEFKIISIMALLFCLPILVYTFSNPYDNERIIYDESFESGSFKAKCSGNCPSVEQSVGQSGSYGLIAKLNYYNSKVNYRTELQPPGFAEFNKEYWYNFSILLPDNHRHDDIWELFAQWHGLPDFELGENWRNPVMALWTENGEWKLTNIWDSKENTFENNKRVYEGQEEWFLGPYTTNEWVEWTFRIKWSFQEDGMIQVWKDGLLVLSKKGPNSFNDQKGPYFKIGIYKGWKNQTPKNGIEERTVFFDNIKISTTND